MAVPDVWYCAYRLENGRYGRPDIAELNGESAPNVVTGVVIEWERVTRRLPRLPGTGLAG
ncbi:MAG: hypothetical protein ACQEUC_09420 [Pseudomonadota bacterium]